MTQPNTTPEGFRTAAYLATKARLDAPRRSRTGKTVRQVTCTPPNVKCGGRCIPPNWDCRIKGQGPDPHLRAVRTDPVSGLANIERGVKRIGKGIRKGSFSEIEGGKRAIVRGVVKATPGDIQRKKALQAQLERRAGGIATALTVVGFGLFSHSQLKRVPFYRDGVGRQIDDSVSAGINRILDVTPGLAGARRERRALGAAAAGAAVSRAAGEAAAGPATLRRELLRTPTQLERRATEYANSRVLLNRVGAVDVSAAASGLNETTWRQKSLEAFWSAKRTNAADVGDGSTFSEPATHEFLSRQFGFRLGSGTDATEVRRQLAGALSREATSLQALARQQGVNIKDEAQRSRFLNRLVGPSTEQFPENVRDRAITNLGKILGTSPSKGQAAVSRKDLADEMYRQTRDGFDQYFGRIADEVRQTPGIAMPAEQRRKGYSDLMNSARIGHARYLATRLSKPENVTNRVGQGLSNAISKEYFARKVKEGNSFTLSDSETVLAASELAGRNITRVGEATRYLQQNGFERLVPSRRAPTRRTQTTATPAQEPRPTRRRSRAQRISDLMRQKNPDGSPRYATREAAEAALERMRGDEDDFSPEFVRTVAYLATRNDFKEGKRLGKPCGASHIPKAHKCTKGEGARSAAPETANTDARVKAIAKAALVAGLTAGAAAAVRNRRILAVGAIRGLSSEQVQEGLSRVPPRFQQSVRNLVGRTKTAVAGVMVMSKGSKIIDVDNTNNIATFSMKSGDIVSISNVGDALVMFRTHPNNTIDYGGGETVGRYVVDFSVDLEHKQTKQDRKQALGVARKVRTMFDKQMSYVPDNSFVTAEAFGKDGLGNKRASIYKKYGFQPIGDVSTHLWATKTRGEFRKMNKREVVSLIGALRSQKRVDFKEGKRMGKPCGASHIQKSYKCQKEQVSVTPQNSNTRKSLTIAAVAGGAVALAVAGSVAYNFKNLSDPNKAPLPPSPNIKELAKAMKKEAGVKSVSEAMGYYYTKKSGLKPGNVVYMRRENDPAAHFGIYIGEGRDGKVRAIMVNTKESRFSWTDVMEIGTTKPGDKASKAVMTPLIKAPEPKFKNTKGVSFTNEEIVKRAIRIADTDYKFSITKDNCEALANGIAYGVPESEQLQRFRRATRAMVDVAVSRDQRREAKEAIFQGRAKGRNYTATEFLTFLQGQREFSSPTGKELAKQYTQYFEGSRLDAQQTRGGLISLDELWSRVKSYGPAVKAQAMADYLLIQRSMMEMDRGRS